MTRVLEVTARRLRRPQLSALAATVILAGALAGLVLAAASLVVTVVWVGYALAAVGAVVVGTLVRHTWTRLTASGRVLGVLPLALAAASLTMQRLALPGAWLVGLAAFAAFVVFVALTAVGRFGFVQWYRLSSTFVRPYVAAERLRLVLGRDALRVLSADGEELEAWPRTELVSAELDPRTRALRFIDRIGDDLLVEIAAGDTRAVERWLANAR